MRLPTRKMKTQCDYRFLGLYWSTKFGQRLNYLPDRLFINLLKWYCSNRLDQWERWKLQTKHGDVFITLSQESDGHSYDELK